MAGHQPRQLTAPHQTIAETTAYLFTILEARWKIVCVGAGLDKGDILVAGSMNPQQTFRCWKPGLPKDTGTPWPARSQIWKIRKSNRTWRKPLRTTPPIRRTMAGDLRRRKWAHDEYIANMAYWRLSGRMRSMVKMYRFV